MNTAEAMKIIQTLAFGVHPYTHETLPQESPYRDIKTVFALNAAIEALKIVKRIETRRSNAPQNSRKAWLPKEERKLVKVFESGATAKKIAEQLQRSEGGIRARLVKLGLIEYDKDDKIYIRK